ncbi:MAG: hypothetical protein FWC82_01045 [Firmicutes bacterium]|nr:hypothetical protein [Bacillota bacterium]
MKFNIKEPLWCSAVAVVATGIVLLVNFTLTGPYIGLIAILLSFPFFFASIGFSLIGIIWGIIAFIKGGDISKTNAILGIVLGVLVYVAYILAIVLGGMFVP